MDEPVTDISSTTTTAAFMLADFYQWFVYSAPLFQNRLSVKSQDAIKSINPVFGCAKVLQINNSAFPVCNKEHDPTFCLVTRSWLVAHLCVTFSHIFAFAFASTFTFIYRSPNDWYRTQKWPHWSNYRCLNSPSLT